MGPSAEDGRRVRSRQTRARLVEVAAEQFVANGYSATTIESLASRAGVAVQTVYYVFGTKHALLAAVLEASIAGDDDPTPVVERSWVDEVREASDAASAVDRFVAGIVAIVSRTAPIFEVVRNASTDPEVRALLEDTKRRRRDDQRQIVELLSARGHLRKGLAVDHVADVVYAVANEEVYLLLSVDCGWDDTRIRKWATTLLQQQVLEA